MQIKNIYLTLLFLLGMIPAIYAQCDGGTVSTIDGDSVATVCLNDTLPDVISVVNTSTAGTQYTYVVTDTFNVILGLPGSADINFANAGAGICRIWGLSYTGTITAMVNDTASSVALSDSCASLSSNYITVVRDTACIVEPSEDCDGGMVSTVDGDTEVTVCLNDTLPDVISVVNTSTATVQYTYVVTDTFNVILGLPGSADINFANAGAGICRIWGLSFTGNVTAAVGDTASAVAITDSCASLSSNYITVIRDTSCVVEPPEDCDGGTVSSAAGDPIYTCPGDSIADVVVFSNTADGENFTYVITDPNGIILGFSTSDTIDFGGAGAGNCLVWGLSYTDTLRAVVGDDATTVSFSDSCADLSDNFITIVREDPDGGIVSTADGETEVTVCLTDSISDVLTFAVNGNSAAKFTFVVTDESNVILGLPADSTADFSSAPAGICRVWGLSFTGNITASVGDTASAVALTDDCFVLSSNFVTVTREDSCDTPDPDPDPDPTNGSFVLVNADTDQDVQAFSNGDSIDVSDIRSIDHLNVRYEPDPSITGIGSVVFDFNGQLAFRIEQIVPYALGGDDNEDYHPVGNSMTLGTHTLVVSVYSSYQGMGDLLSRDSITFTLVDGPVSNSGGDPNPDPDPDPTGNDSLAVVSYTLVNADTNSDIMPLNDGDEIDYASLGTSNISIRANTSPEEVGSVVFSFRGASNFRTENVFPYTLGGDINGDYWSVEIPNGDYTLTATPYSEAQHSGDEGTSLTINFSVVSSPFARMQVQSDTRRLLAFPNPVESNLFLEMPEGRVGPVQVDIVTPMGNLVQRERFTTNTDHWSRVISTDNLQPGIYIIHVTNGMFRRTVRIVRD